METAADRLSKIRLLALTLTALSLLVVLVSAVMRLDAAGLGCADWPICYGQLLGREPQALQFGAVRVLHRLGASASLLLGCVLVWSCWRPQAVQPAATYAAALLLLMLTLATLGIWSADPRRVLVGFLNIMGGLGLVTFSWRVFLASGASRRVQSPARGVLLRIGVVGLSLTAMLGAWLGASYSALACVSFPSCGGVWWPSSEGLSALNPFFRALAAPAAGDAGGQLLHLLHRYLALATLVVLGVAAVQLLRQGATRLVGRMLIGLLVVEVGLGVATVLSGLTLWLVVAHGVGAAVLLATVATLLRR